jgi:hypothetical protein
LGDILFEFVQVGQTMRVAAIDEATGTEVVVITPLNAARGHMERLALAKLQRKLAGETAGDPVLHRGPGKLA